MSPTRNRQPRELLRRISEHCCEIANYEDAPIALQIAAGRANSDAIEAYCRIRPDTPKRPSYYGAKGSLRNPFRT